MAGFNWLGFAKRLFIRYVLQDPPQTDADSPGAELLPNIAKCYVGSYLAELFAAFTAY